MQWEFLGKQELKLPLSPRKSYTYATAMWRTPVPGGWLVMSLNMNGMAPQPATVFYPDPEHVWQPTTPLGAELLLRPAVAADISPSENLLRSTEEDQT